MIAMFFGVCFLLSLVSSTLVLGGMLALLVIFSAEWIMSA